MKLSPAPEAPDNWEVQLRKGGLELAILATLWGGRRYGLEILQHLESGSDLIISEGTIYPLLNRMKASGWLRSEWVESGAGHPRKYYSLTSAGRQRVVKMEGIWSRFAESMIMLLRPIAKESRNHA